MNYLNNPVDSSNEMQIQSSNFDEFELMNSTINEGQETFGIRRSMENYSAVEAEEERIDVLLKIQNMCQNEDTFLQFQKVLDEYKKLTGNDSLLTDESFPSEYSANDLKNVFVRLQSYSNVKQK